MATLQDIIAKRKELGEGATNVDARKALTATASPPPQAPVPEPINPSAPNPAISALPVQPTGGATIPIAKPETAPTPVPTPTPTPVPEVKPQEPVKPVTPVKEAIDYTQGAGREAEINKNLNEFYNQGTTDPESLKKMSGYAEATPEKKAIIDSFISAKAPNADWLFQSLRSGAPVAPSLQNTPEYKQAQARYNKLQTYQRYSPSQVTTALRTGDIIPGTKEYNDLYTDPAVKAKIDEANAFAVINGGYDFEAIGTKKTSELISQNTNVSNALSDGYISEEELVNMTNTQEVIARATDYQTKADLYTQKKTEFDNIEKTVRADMDKLGLASFSSIVNARIAEAREALLPELTIAQNEMNTSYGIYTDAKAQALSVVDRNIALYQEERKFAQQKEMIQYQADVGLQTQQREFEQGLEQQAQLASDPVTGVNNIVDTFEKMGIFADRSRQEMVQEVQSKMAQGMTVGEALSDLQAAFKSKPEYQKQMSLVMGQMSDMEKTQMQYQQQMAMNDRNFSQQLALNDVNFNQDVQRMAMQYDMNDAQSRTEFRRDLIGKGMSETQADAIVRNETGDWNGVTGEKLLYAKDGTFIKSTLPETTNPNGGIECAEYISKMIGSKVGSTWEEKLARNTETTGGVGSIVVWQPAKTGPLAKYGHAGIIVNDLGDSWEVKSANYNLDGRITTDTIPKSEDMRYRSTKLGEKMQGGGTGTGTGENNKLATLGQFMKDNQDTGVGYSNEDVKRFDAKIDKYIQNGDEQGMAIAYRNMLMKDKDFKEKFDQTQEFTDALDNVQTLISDYEKAGKSTNALNNVAETVARKLGLTTDQALAQLQTQLGVTMANYIKSISGTAASDTEVQRLMGNMANIKNVSELNNTIVNQVRDNAQSSLKKMINTRMYGMPEELKPKVFGDIYIEEAKQIQMQEQKSDFMSKLDSIANKMQSEISSIQR